MAKHTDDLRNSELIESLKHKDKISVLFVCLGNICRSPAAEGILRAIVAEHGEEDRWEIDSAGIGAWHTGQLPDQRMRVHARRRGLYLTHHARQVREADFEKFDLIVGMDEGNLSDLRELAPTVEAERRLVPMIDFVHMATRYDYIPDPYYEGAEGFELVLDLLQDGLENMYNMLK